MTGAMFCDGRPIGSGGTYIGHVLPGAVLAVWALHWLQGSLRQYMRSQRTGELFRSQAYYSLPGLPPFPLEGVIVVAFTMIGMYLEMMGLHSDGFQSLLCEPDTPRAGHLNGDHINNWQHATMYIGFMISGAVYLVGWCVPLSHGTEKTFLSLAFAEQALLMGLHTKDEPLDRFLHQALAGASALCCVAVALEALHPHSYVASCGRVAGTLLQALILIETAEIKHKQHTKWQGTDGDMAPFQFAKVLLTQTVALLLAAYVALHVVVHVVQHATSAHSLALGQHVAYTDAGARPGKGTAGGDHVRVSAGGFTSPYTPAYQPTAVIEL